MRFLTFPEQSNCTAICTHCLASHNGTPSTKTIITTIKPPLLCDLHPWIQPCNAGCIREKTCEDRTRRTDKVPYIAAGMHFVRENIEFGAIPTLSCITGRSNPTSLWWCGDVVMWCDVVMWWCEDVVMGWCIVVVIYCFCDVLFWWFWWYIIVVMYYCGDVLLWWCIVVVMYCSGDVLLWWCIVGGCFFLTSIFQKFRATEFRLLNFLWRRQSCKNQQPRIRKQLWDILVQMSQVPIYLVEAAFTGIPKTETDRFGDSY